jgi:hypothetical protein
MSSSVPDFLQNVSFNVTNNNNTKIKDISVERGPHALVVANPTNATYVANRLDNTSLIYHVKVDIFQLLCHARYAIRHKMKLEYSSHDFQYFILICFKRKLLFRS